MKTGAVHSGSAQRRWTNLRPVRSVLAASSHSLFFPQGTEQKELAVTEIAAEDGEAFVTEVLADEPKKTRWRRSWGRPPRKKERSFMQYPPATCPAS